jgi:hypothetical protein
LGDVTLLLHGETGGWDELLIAIVAFGVLWIAVKLAGRKPATEDEALVENDGEHQDPVPPSAPKLG